MNRRGLLAALGAGLAVVIVAGLALARPRQAQTLTVFAAASLTDAFSAIAADFEAAHPGVTVALNFAGSSTLAAQLAEGAPADVFASANPRQMTAAEESGRIAADVAQTFAHNHLVLGIPANNDAGIESLHDLATPGVLLVLAAPEVPVRNYTDTLLDALAANAAYGPEWREAVMANLASEEVDVRGVVTRLALDEADAGIIYSSDITPDVAAQVASLPIPDAVNPLASYPIAVVTDSPHADLAAAFVDAVLAPDGQAVLTHWGFLPGELE